MPLDLPWLSIGEGRAFLGVGRKGRCAVKSTKFLLSSVAAGVILLGSTGTARAQQWDSCSVRVQKDQRDLDRAIHRYGYDSRQAQHEQDELERDAANCGYDVDRYRSYRDRDDWRYRDDGRYRENYDRGYGDYDAAFDNGYRDGLTMGERDAQRNRAFRPNKNDWYEDADRGYNRAYGDKNLYRYQYRRAFEQGYSEGYRRWR